MWECKERVLGSLFYVRVVSISSCSSDNVNLAQLVFLTTFNEDRFSMTPPQFFFSSAGKLFSSQIQIFKNPTNTILPLSRFKFADHELRCIVENTKTH